MPVKLIDQPLVNDLQARAAASPRRRMNYNLHGDLNDPVQRFFNAMEPDTYVRPHRHRGAGRWELFLAVRGSVAMVLFDDAGRLTERHIVSAGGPLYAIEIPENTWHALACLEPGSIMYESKTGPYQQPTDKDFATWAPMEGEATCAIYIEWYRSGAIGSRAG